MTGVFPSKARERTGLFLVTVILVLATGCGGSGGGKTTTPAPTVSISVNPSAINQGDSATLTWSTTNASSVNASGAWSGSQATSGTLSVTPSAPGTYTYGLNVTGSGGSTSGSATLTVRVVAAPTLDSSISPTTIVAGDTAILTWASTNATTAIASGDWSGSEPVNSSWNVTPLTAGTYAYTLKVMGPGGSVSKTVKLTVNPKGKPWINSISPNTAYSDTGMGLGNVHINGTGFAAGCTVHLGSWGDLTLLQGTLSTEIIVSFSIDTPHYRPAFNPFSVTCSGATSNTAWFVFIGSQNTLAFDPVDNLLLQLEQGLYNGEGGHVMEFPIGPTGTLTSSGHLDGVGTSNGIAFDPQTGLVGVSFQLSTSQTLWIDPKNNVSYFRTDYTGNQNTMAIAAEDGYACMTTPAAGLLQCFQLSRSVVTGPLFSASVGSQPFALAMTHVGGERDAIVYSREDTTLWRVSVPDMTVKSSLALTGILKWSEVQKQSVGGGWQIAVFNSGPAAGIAAVLSSADYQLVFVDLATMAEVGRVNLLTSSGVDGYPIRLATDETHGTVFVAFSDAVNGVSRFTSVDAKTSTVKPLATTSTLLASGFGASTDGSQLYVCNWNQCEADAPSASVAGSAAAMSLESSSVVPAGSMPVKKLLSWR